MTPRDRDAVAADALLEAGYTEEQVALMLLRASTTATTGQIVAEVLSAGVAALLSVSGYQGPRAAYVPLIGTQPRKEPGHG